jgi:hypothetical protein
VTRAIDASSYVILFDFFVPLLEPAIKLVAVYSDNHEVCSRFFVVGASSDDQLRP